jgi:hypothetical protein
MNTNTNVSNPKWPIVRQRGNKVRRQDPVSMKIGPWEKVADMTFKPMSKAEFMLSTMADSTNEANAAMSKSFTGMKTIEVPIPTASGGLLTVALTNLDAYKVDTLRVVAAELGWQGGLSRVKKADVIAIIESLNR